MSEPGAESDTKRGGDYVYDALVNGGIDLLVGLPGTQTLPLDRVVAESDEISYVMARHETSIPHIAWGYYEATGKPAATVTVPGPGDTNAIHGLKNAYDDCVPIIHVSTDVAPEDRGNGPIHEIPVDTYDNAVKANVNVESTVELTEEVEHAIQTALTPPYGPVRIGIPSSILTETFIADRVSVETESVRRENEAAYTAAVEVLTRSENPLLYVGGGARRSSGSVPVIRELSETLSAPVLSTYKGKGVFPEAEPRFLGVSAKHLPTSSRRVLEAADVVLALGTDFDGLATAEWTLPMGETLIHVNLNAGDIDRGYESDVAIVADVREACIQLLDEIPDTGVGGWDGAGLAKQAREEYLTHLESQGLLEDDPVHTPGALRTVRDVLPRDAIVTTDVGGFRLWAKHVFETNDPRQYVTPGSWAGMGVGLPAALGAKFANRDRAVVALTGDGGLMMCLTELHTAVEHELDVTTIVFNNSDYGIISQSPKIDQYADGRRFEWDSPDFVSIADGFGCRALRVGTRTGLADALATALDKEGPRLIDVGIPSDEQSVVDANDYEPTHSVL
jgi:acetolactate synthase-1/2/3 large subunit